MKITKNDIFSITCSLTFMMVVVLIFIGVNTLLPPQNFLNESKYKQYAAIFLESDNEEQILMNIIQAGGRPVRHTYFDNMIISASLDENHKQHLYNAGASIVFNPLITGSCFIQNKSAFNN